MKKILNFKPEPVEPAGFGPLPGLARAGLCHTGIFIKNNDINIIYLARIIKELLLNHQDIGLLLCGEHCLPVLEVHIIFIVPEILAVMEVIKTFVRVILAYHVLEFDLHLHESYQYKVDIVLIERLFK
jgi:hypothetical protein